MSKNTNPSQKRIRFAIYTRYSSDMQNDLSLEAQEYRCRQAIADRGGVIVERVQRWGQKWLEPGTRWFQRTPSRR